MEYLSLWTLRNDIQVNGIGNPVEGQRLVLK